MPLPLIKFDKWFRPSLHVIRQVADTWFLMSAGRVQLGQNLCKLCRVRSKKINPWSGHISAWFTMTVLRLLHIYWPADHRRMTTWNELHWATKECRCQETLAHSQWSWDLATERSDSSTIYCDRTTSPGVDNLAAQGRNNRCFGSQNIPRNKM